MRLSLLLGTAAALSGLVVTACSVGPPRTGPEDRGGERAALVAVTPTVTLVAVGDIACPAGAAPTTTACRQAGTARLTRSLDPDRVLALGDLQYENGSYHQFVHSYDRSWGSLRPLTRPLLGNHEYRTSGAAGYHRYFGGRQPGYYAWDAGAWRIYNLNSNCAEISCPRQLGWFAADLAAHPRACSIMASHHPRFSSGAEHGDTASMQPFWQVADRYGIDIALAGHDHDYERFIRLDALGRPDRQGIQSFVSGTGGRSLYRMGARKPGSAYFHGQHHGVLVLRLAERSWTWAFHTLDGVVRDSGMRSCVGTSG